MAKCSTSAKNTCKSLGAPVVPGCRRVTRKRQLIGKIDARIELRTVGAEVEIQNLRQQDDPVEIDVAISFQEIDQRSRARRAIAFAEQVFGGVPPAVFG